MSVGKDEEKPTINGRKSNGQFADGNPGGPGRIRRSMRDEIRKLLYLNPADLNKYKPLQGWDAIAWKAVSSARATGEWREVHAMIDQLDGAPDQKHEINGNVTVMDLLSDIVKKRDDG